MGKVKSYLWEEPEFDNDYPYTTHPSIHTRTGTDMHISKMTPSNFLKKDDVEPPIFVTIKSVSQQNVAMADQPEETKWCLHFHECEKPLALNITNIGLTAQVLSQEDSDNWIGGKIVLYNDPSISYGGKITGGIRVRAPKNQPAPGNVQTAQPAMADDGFNDDVPF